MKNIIKLLFLFSLVSFASCNSDDNNGGVVKDVREIYILDLDMDTIHVVKGEAYTISIKTEPANAPVRFSSDNARVVSVHPTNGELTINAGGSARINIVAPNGDDWTRAKCIVSAKELVEEIVPVLGKDVQVLNSTTTSLGLSSSFDVLPVTATLRTVRYESSNPAVATVNASGTVTRVGKGIVEITAIANDAGEVRSTPITIVCGYAQTQITRNQPSTWSAVANSIEGNSNTSGTYGTYRIIDGSTANFWHASWSAPVPPPHYVIIDMKAAQTFNYVRMARRSSYRDTRNVEYYTTNVVTDGVSYDDPSFVKIGSITFGDLPAATTTMDFIPIPLQNFTTRYFLIKLLDSNRNGAAGDQSVAEMYFYNLN